MQVAGALALPRTIPGDSLRLFAPKRAQLETHESLSPQSQGHNLALTVLNVPYIVDCLIRGATQVSVALALPRQIPGDGLRLFSTSKWDQIAYFRFLIVTGARRNPAIWGTNQGD